MSKINIPLIVQDAWELAKKTRLNAYAPYSHFLVGSALKFKKDKKVYVGCNFENASYGATICAERNALGAAIANGAMKSKKKDALEFILVVTNTTESTPPCGLCLQALSEFANAETIVYLATTKAITQRAKFYDFLPAPFKEIEVL